MLSFSKYCNTSYLVRFFLPNSVLLYLVTTGWIFVIISLCENSINQKNKALCYFRRISASHDIVLKLFQKLLTYHCYCPTNYERRGFGNPRWIERNNTNNTNTGELKFAVGLIGGCCLKVLPLSAMATCTRTFYIGYPSSLP